MAPTTSWWRRRFAIVSAACLAYAVGSGLPTPPTTSSGCRVIVEANASATSVSLFLPGGSTDSSDLLVLDGFASVPGDLAKQGPSTAYNSIKTAFHKVVERIPEENRPMCSVHLYATGSMRSLPSEEQKAIYDALAVDFQKDESVPLVLERNHLETLTADEEAYYVVLSANILAKRVGSDLEPTDLELYGSLDLTQASSQIVVDVEHRWRYNSRKKSFGSSRPLRRIDFFALTFSNFGRHSLLAQVSSLLEAKNSTENPCLFKGSNDDANRTGGGDAVACLQLVQQLVDTSNAKCATDTYCALDAISQPRLSGPYFAFGDFYRMALFAKDVLHLTTPIPTVPFDFPTPALAEITQAAKVVCSEPFDRVQALPSADSTRCLDLCYTSVLLKQFGFTDDEKRVMYVEELHDEPIRWTRGVYWSLQVEARQAYETALGDYLSAQVDMGLPVGWNLALLVLVFAIVALVNLVHRASNNGTTHALEFVHDASQ
ncbi:unnamed protein product [Aphanomyces euteiches]|uniref:VWFA domain-containing protein n=1 Tax=Aphanomyces euteiches TaxID=100861 RepID=A0A6G0WKG2_9STRA|nr:hypothetical protein Ae201684_014276 [Aphanomyces euteiches]KAH9068866.1 hypothetical protein Ae201684P_004564 [Aphanomyces euteiches]KAH9139782.1 hypothetical protein AeRB84_015948 [Aphanomyces euteiches]